MSESKTNNIDGASEAKAAFRDMATLWHQAQSSLSLFISAVVWDSHAAEDIHQEVARVVTERFSSYDRDRPFTPWVLGIARICVAKYLRVNHQKPLIFDEKIIADLAQELPRIEPELERRKQALRLCIESLKGTAKRIVSLRYLKEMDMESVAKEVGLSRNAARVALHRARNLLAGCIERKLSPGRS
ncbi:MAG: sigma-70 family RNA polymerase sigma factor [Pirellulales bacterium]|nr:sigma-70 family RNA polymerase sigma factor [Pirellulales bacterium]